ncbi:MAG: FtsQ-type POTRA domain-containing protein, partial [Clostridia bacterium]
MDGQQKFRRKSAKFETMQQQQQKKRVKRRIFYTFLLVFFSAAFFTICFTVFFKVKNIDLDGNNKYTPEEIIKTLQISSGDNMYSFNSAETSEKLIKQFPYIQTAEITRVLPSTVKVSIIEKKVVMYIYACNEYYLLAPDFTVLERSDELRYDGLIQLTCGDIKRCMTGEQLSFSDSKLTPTLAELYQLMSTYKINDKIKSINVENRFDIT